MNHEKQAATLVIMPAWNEEEAIGNTIAEILALQQDFDVLVVNDGSRDKTAQVARAAGATVMDLPFNLGVGGAMRAGYHYALRRGYRQAIQVDSDGQHNPEDIARVLAGLQHADISIGARFAGVGEYHAAGPRWWAMQVLAKILSRITGAQLTDTTSGFRAANRHAIKQYCKHFPAEYLGDTIDSLVVAARSGLRVTQVPVAMRERQGGTPSASPYKAMIYLFRAFFAMGLALTRKTQQLVREEEN